MNDDRETGYVRLHRQILTSDLWRETPHCRVVALTLLIRAEWRPGGNEQPHPETHQMIRVPRGYVLMGLRDISAAAHISRPTATSAVNRLVEVGFVVRTEYSALYHLPGYERFNPLKQEAKLQNNGTYTPVNQEAKLQKTPGGDLPNLPGGGQPNLPGLAKQIEHPWPNDLARLGPLSIFAVKNKNKKVKKVARDAPEGQQGEFKLSHSVPPKRKADPDHIAAVLAAYSEGIERQYGFRPSPPTTVDRSHARDLVLQHGHVHAIELARAYPGVEDDFLSKQGHPFRMLLRNQNAIEVHLRGLGPRKKRDPLRIETDSKHPDWNYNQLWANPLPKPEKTSDGR